MATVIVTWDNPSDAASAKAADAKAAQWRATALKQPGLLEFTALVSVQNPHTGIILEDFATGSEAGAYLGSDQFAKIVSEMTAAGITNIKASLWNAHPDVPKTLRPE
ncbi:antibiotic biosynthesis monooxygenase [Burkholderia ubonensis]|uniref:antibiotic biosynthesis monooxygenase n=1 Tax=Burkholderia ubonensis TaxID=101571 RepID=UPI000AF7B360|nr:antibiotic biosynthesis monooxygenase [Burkholderia ubonensis]